MSNTLAPARIGNDCTCGHERSDHRRYGIERGGECTRAVGGIIQARGCPCKDFSPADIDYTGYKPCGHPEYRNTDAGPQPNECDCADTRTRTIPLACFAAVCPDCGGPLHLVQGGTENGAAWYHESNAALMACPFTRKATR